jgi:hypothetical protein
MPRIRSRFSAATRAHSRDVEQPQILGLADHHGLREREDARIGQVEIGQDAHRRGLDHMGPEAGKIARARAAGIDEGRHRAAARERFRRHAQRSAAPVDMRVQVDQAGGHDLAAYVARVLALQIVADRCDLAAAEGDVGDAVDTLRRVDHPATLQHKIMHRRNFPLETARAG